MASTHSNCVFLSLKVECEELNKITRNEKTFRQMGGLQALSNENDYFPFQFLLIFIIFH